MFLCDFCEGPTRDKKPATFVLTELVGVPTKTRNRPAVFEVNTAMQPHAACDEHVVGYLTACTNGGISYNVRIWQQPSYEPF